MPIDEKTSTLLHVKVTPNAKTNQLSFDGDLLKCRLRAPAVDGKANAAMIELLSEVLQLPRRAITILRGETSRSKQVRIHGMSKEEIEHKVEGTSKQLKLQGKAF